MWETVELTVVHWMSLITKAATVFYYNSHGPVLEHTKYEAAHLVLFANTPSTRQHISSVPEHTKYEAAHLVLFPNTPSTRQHI